MPQVSINWLSDHTGKDRRTIKKRLDGIAQTDGKFDSKAALEAIFLDFGGDDEKITTPEAVRRLTIRKDAEIALDMEIKRKERIPIDDIKTAQNEAFQAVAGTLKANCGKVLDLALINEISATIRDQASDMIGDGE